mgnify:CR=1 FL=1
MGDDDMFAMDWGDKGESLWSCNCAPCCGDPCNPGDGIMCILCWWCCGPCSMSALYSYSLDQDCAYVNHCVWAWFCGLCAATSTRHNLRVKQGKGKPANDTTGIIGDLLCVWCCGLCALGQMLRSVDNDKWDWQNKMSGAQTMTEWKFFIDK